LVHRYPQKTSVCIGYEEGVAHRLHAGADILLAPARFEPCGLSQLYALRYGTTPIVRRTGGLADTVTDIGVADTTATGFVFEEADSAGLMGAVKRALALYEEPLAWRRLQLKGMEADFGWATSAERYGALYREVSGISYSAQISPAVGETTRQIAS
jgi:starch synthase